MTTKSDKDSGRSRRAFLRKLGAGTAALGLLPLKAHASEFEVQPATRSEGSPASGLTQRLEGARKVRLQTLDRILNRGTPTHRNNGDESSFPRIATYTKALPHDQLGVVSAKSYKQYLRALESGLPKDWERITMGGPKKFKNPLAGLTYDLEGFDPSQFRMRPAPKINSAEHAAETAELYWMALCRDINFIDYQSNSTIASACADLSALSDFRGPTIAGLVTPATIFRGQNTNALVGPYISQFLYRDVPFGSLTISNRQATVVSALDYLYAYEFWLAAQNGFAPGVDQLDHTKRYIRNGRDLAHYMHIDRLVQSFMNAALICQFDLAVPFNLGNPYVSSATMSGFGNFDYPHMLVLLHEVATRALRAVWYQKWFVHRRLRPEEYAGLVHNRITQNLDYPAHSELLNSTALSSSFNNYGSYLLAQAYPEGCPPHPAYGSGHAVVAGACATVLKFWFDQSTPITSPVVPNSDGTTLESYAGDDADAMTVGGEIDKLAYNQGLGRDFAGVHYRSDIEEGLRLGESVAIEVLQQQKLTYPEKIEFSFLRFNGKRFRIVN